MNFEDRLITILAYFILAGGSYTLLLFQLKDSLKEAGMRELSERESQIAFSVAPWLVSPLVLLGGLLAVQQIAPIIFGWQQTGTVLTICGPLGIIVTPVFTSLAIQVACRWWLRDSVSSDDRSRSKSSPVERLAAAMVLLGILSLGYFAYGESHARVDSVLEGRSRRTGRTVRKINLNSQDTDGPAKVGLLGFVMIFGGLGVLATIDGRRRRAARTPG